MKLSHRWLARYLLEVPAPDAIESALTQMGIEVALREPWGQDYAAVELVRVVTRHAHPNADHLSVVTVQRFGAVTTDVVTGATNGLVGEMLWYAPPGTRLPDGRILETVSMRGIPSPGMLLSAEELGFSDPGGDLWVYSGKLPIGSTFLDALGGPDTIYELELTPNLAVFDQSVLGIAREIAAVLNLSCRSLDGAFQYGKDAALVGAVDSMACPLYGLTEVRLEGEAVTPLWMQVLLLSIGLRVIHPVVDITNFILWDIGQPLHAFDADKVALPISVRRAKFGETMTFLDGSPGALSPEDLVIADNNGPIALAGIMGGQRAAVTEATRHVFLESAYFNAPGIFKSARHHHMVSDAAQHFGKGADPSLVPIAAEVAVALMREILAAASHVVASALHGSIPPQRDIPFEPDRIRQILGVPWTDNEIAEGLGRLRFELVGGRVRIPWDRHDVLGTEDLSEEVARVWGFDTITATLPSSAAKPGLRDHTVSFVESMRDKWATLGYWEVVTRPFWHASRDVLGRGSLDQPILVTNPLREEEAELRQDLVPSLLEVLAYNRGRRDQPVAIFEVAPIYYRRDHNPLELMAVAAAEVLEAPAQYPPSPNSGIYRLKGALEWVNQQLNLRLQQEPSGAIPAFMHPGRSVALYDNTGTRVGYLGEIRPRIAHLQFRAPRIAVMSLAPAVAAAAAEGGVIAAPSKYPDVVRDLSLVGLDLSYQTIRQTITASRVPNLFAVRPIDVFEGEFGKSLTVRLVFQSMTRTLTDAEVESAVQHIVDALKSHGISRKDR